MTASTSDAASSSSSGPTSSVASPLSSPPPRPTMIVRPPPRGSTAATAALEAASTHCASSTMTSDCGGSTTSSRSPRTACARSVRKASSSERTARLGRLSAPIMSAISAAQGVTSGATARRRASQHPSRVDGGCIRGDVEQRAQQCTHRSIRGLCGEAIAGDPHRVASSDRLVHQCGLSDARGTAHRDRLWSGIRPQQEAQPFHVVGAAAEQRARRIGSARTDIRHDDDRDGPALALDGHLDRIPGRHPGACSRRRVAQRHQRAVARTRGQSSCEVRGIAHRRVGLTERGADESCEHPTGCRARAHSEARVGGDDPVQRRQQAALGVFDGSRCARGEEVPEAARCGVDVEQRGPGCLDGLLDHLGERIDVGQDLVVDRSWAPSSPSEADRRPSGGRAPRRADRVAPRTPGARTRPPSRDQRRAVP